MTVKTIAGTVVRESTALALGAVRHPIGTAAGAVGLARGVVRGAAGVSLRVLHGQHPGTQAPTPRVAVPDPEAPESPSSPQDVAPDRVPASSSAPATPPDSATATPETDVREELPGPDLFEPPPTDPADLPEPIVIVAEDEGEEAEALHTEPKPSSRASEHGGPAGDREEIEGYVEEIPPLEEQPGLRS